MGRPKDNTGSLYGWVAFKDGAFVGNEPEGASTWYPVNDVSYDKATLHVRDHRAARARSGWATGSCCPRATQGTKTTYRWAATEPMASYLSMAASGNYTLTTVRGPARAPDRQRRRPGPGTPTAVAAVLDLQPEMITFFEGRFGPYPFGSFGAVVDDDDKAGLRAREPDPARSTPACPDESTVAHELAHQCFGDNFKPSAVAGHLAQRRASTTCSRRGSDTHRVRPADPRSRS